MNTFMVSFLSMLFFFGGPQHVGGNLINRFITAGVEAAHVKPTDDNPKPIRVTVKKTDNSVVVGATVKLYNSVGILLQTGTSNSQGEFTFDPVNPGSYLVSATKSGYSYDDDWVVVTNSNVSVTLTIDEL